MLKRFLIANLAQDIVEYALLLAFLALASASVFISTAGSMSSIWSTANSTLEKGQGYAFGKGHGSGNPGRGNPQGP